MPARKTTAKTTTKTKAAAPSGEGNSDNVAQDAIVATSEMADALTESQPEGGADGDPTTGAGGEYWAKRQQRRHGGMSSERANELERKDKKRAVADRKATRAAL